LHRLSLGSRLCFYPMSRIFPSHRLQGKRTYFALR